ncbi:terminase family protein [Candidatus Dojkabacteria bacterium]|jgi:hypothetical protein|nr:terminase family protein [Candidatus Dojkabacteria bacterium]
MISDEKLQQLISFYPHNKQKEILLCDSKEIIVCAGRRFGKSALCGYIIVKELLNGLDAIRKGKRQSCKIWIVAPTYELTNKVFEYVIKFLLAFDKDFGRYVSGGQGRPGTFKLSESIWIQCKSTTEPMSLLGEELDLEIIDEAALIPETVYNQYIYPTTIAKSRDTKVVMISTPRGANWFKNKFNILKEKGAAFQFTTLDGVETDEVKLEEIKKSTPELMFRQEYMAEFVSDAGIVFRNVDKAIVPYREEDGKRDHFYIMGVDLGTVNDYTVVTVIDRNSHQVVHWDRFKGIDYTQQKDIIRAKALKYNGSRVIIDATGVGRPIYDDLRNSGVFVEDFTLSGKTKEELIGREIVFIDEMYIRVPNIPVLVDELKAYEYKFINERTGELLRNTKYGAPVGYHDDAVISFGLAIWGLNLQLPSTIDPISQELKKYRKPTVKTFI